MFKCICDLFARLFSPEKKNRCWKTGTVEKKSRCPVSGGYIWPDDGSVFEEYIFADGNCEAIVCEKKLRYTRLQPLHLIEKENCDIVKNFGTEDKFLWRSQAMRVNFRLILTMLILMMSILVTGSFAFADSDAIAPEVTISLNGPSSVSDPDFAVGNSGFTTYNNTTGGSMQINRVADSSAPNSSGYVLHVSCEGATGTSYGGVNMGTPASLDTIIVTKIIAKIPVGYKIYFTTNGIGNNSSSRWLTSQAGTGDWETYIYYIRTGSSGTFATTNYYYLKDGPAPTEGNPVEWDIAYANVYRTDLMSWTNEDVTITANALDTDSGVVAYAFTNTNVEPTTWTNISATTNLVSDDYTMTDNGTLYFWAKDANGNVGKIATYVERIDRVPPKVQVDDIYYGENANIKLTNTTSMIKYFAVTTDEVVPTDYGTDDVITGDILNYWYKILLSGSASYVTFSGLDVGSYYAWAEDDAGNQTCVTFNVLKQDGNASVSLENWEYGQTPKTPVITSDTNSVSGALIEYKYGDTYDTAVPTNAGYYEIKVTLPENDRYATTVVTSNFQIIPRNVNNITLTLENVSYTYDGEAKRPDITLSDEFEIASTDYFLVYSNNINAGTATVSVIGRENYVGTLEATFEIAKKELIVTPVAGSKGIGRNDPLAYVYTVSGYVEETAPTIIGTLSREPGEELGEYEILQGTLALASWETNYTLTVVSGVKFSIVENHQISDALLMTRMYANIDLIIGAGRVGLAYEASSVKSITFLDEFNIPNDVIWWDVSENVDGTVVAWIIPTEENEELYDLYIAADGTITAPTNCNSLFANYSSCKSIINIDKLDMSNIESATEMFSECSSLTSIDLSGMNTSRITDMNKMFYKCSSLTSLNISSFDTSNVTDMSSMFRECTKLRNLNLGLIDTSNVTNMSDMFYECIGLTTVDVTHFNTSNVTDMSGMFRGCTGLTSLDVTHFNTSNVINMNSMFHTCRSLANIDVSHFDTSSLETMTYMFYGCRVATLDVSNFDTTNVTNAEYAFASVQSLKGFELTIDIGESANIYQLVGSNPSRLVSVLIGENVSRIGNDVFLGDNSLQAIILTESAETTSDVITKLDADNGIYTYNNAKPTFYVPNNSVANYLEVWSNANSNITPDRVQPILAINEPTTYVVQGTSFVDKGATVAGFKTSESANYTQYGFQLVTQGIDAIDNTSIGSIYPVTYTLMKDGEEVSSIVRNVRIIEIKPTIMKRTTTAHSDGIIEGLYIIGCYPEDNRVKHEVDGFVFDYDSLKIKTITIMDNKNTLVGTELDGLTVPTGTVSWWDVSMNRNESVIACLAPHTDLEGMYDLYLMADGAIKSPADASYMFATYKECIHLNRFELFDTSDATTMQGMFQDLTSMLDINLSQFNLEKVTTIRSLFKRNYSLKHIDLTGVTTGTALKNASEMFCDCTSLETVNMDLFGAPNIVDIEKIFNGCTSLKYINLSHFYTKSNPTSYTNFFAGCTNLKSVLYGDGVDLVSSIMYGSDPNLSALIMQKDVSAEDAVVPALTSTSLKGSAPKLVVYVPNEASRQKYIESWSAKTTQANESNIKPILGYTGNKVAMVPVGSVYNDNGITVAGFTADEAEEYMQYGYKLIRDCDIDTSEEGIYEINYTLMLVDDVVDTLTRTVFVEDEATTYITEWTIPVDADGEGLGTTIKLPIPGYATNEYLVDFGDGEIGVFGDEGFPEHTYMNTTEKTYTIKVTGFVNRIGYAGTIVPTATNTYNNYYTFTQYVSKIVQWGDLDAIRYGFGYCRNLRGTIPSPAENSFKYVTTFAYAFTDCTGLTGTIPSDLFANAIKVTSYCNTFAGCTGLSGEIPIGLFESNLAISTVPRGLTSSSGGAFERTFMNCTNITSAGINSLYIGFEMFKGCQKLKTITIGDKVQAVGTNAFLVGDPYSQTNPLLTTVKTQNQAAIDYDWFEDNRLADIFGPVIEVSNIGIGESLKITLTDEISGTQYFAVTQDLREPTEFGTSNVSTGATLNFWYKVAKSKNPINVTFTELLQGSYYVWGRDAVNNVSYVEVEVSEARPLLMARQTTDYVIGANRASLSMYTPSMIKTITLLGDNTVPEDILALAELEGESRVVRYWDVSENINGAVMAWLRVNAEDETMYDLYIGGKGNIIAPANCTNLFKGYNKCTKINNFELLDTSNTTSMYYMLSDLNALTSINTSSLDTHKVTTMYGMFYNCRLLKNIDVSNFDTGKVTNFSNMFWHCETVEKLEVNDFDMRKATNISYMFYACYRLVDFDYTSWELPNLTGANSVKYIFHAITDLKGFYLKLPIKSNMDTQYVISGNQSNLRSVLIGEEVEKITQNMFTNDKKLVSIIIEAPAETAADVKTLVADNGEYKLNAKTVFYVPNAESVSAYIEAWSDVNSNISTDNVKPILCLTQDHTYVNFCAKYSERSLYVAGFGMNESENYTQYGYEIEAIGLDEIDTRVVGAQYPVTYILKRNGEEIDRVSKVVEVINMVAHLMPRDNVGTLPGTSNTGSTTIIGAATRASTAYESNKVKTITFMPYIDIPSDTIEAWDVSEEENEGVMAWIRPSDLDSTMYDLYIASNGQIMAPQSSAYLFCYYPKCVSINNFEYLDTSDVTSMQGMFQDMQSLVELDISSFDISNVTTMRSMFKRNYKLTYVNLEGLRSEVPIDISQLFMNCNAMVHGNLKGFEVPYATSIVDLFNGCSKLETIDLSGFACSSTTTYSNFTANSSKLKSVLYGENIPFYTGAMFASKTNLEFIIMERDVSSDEVTPPELLTTNVVGSNGAIVYVPNAASVDEYISEWSVVTSTANASNIKPLMELIGAEEVHIWQNSTFVDDGVKVAGADKDNAEKYEFYGYSVEVSTDLDTSVAGEYEVNYNLIRNNEIVDALTRIVYVDSSNYSIEREGETYYYGTLKAAYDSITDSTLTIIKVEQSNTDNSTINIDSTKNVIIDLNGNTITIDGIESGIFIQNYGTLVLEDSVGTGKIYMSHENTTGSIEMFANNNGKMTVNGGEYELYLDGNASGYPSLLRQLNPASELTMNGGTWKYTNNTACDWHVAMIIKDGKFTMNDGSIEAISENDLVYAIRFEVPEIEITGGTISATANQKAYAVSALAWSNGDASKGKLKVTGNVAISANSENNDAFGIYNDYITSDIIIEGGTFEVNGPDSYYVDALRNNKGKLIIGTEGGVVSTTSPNIKATRYAAKASDGIEFYDGILKAKNSDVVNGDMRYETGYIPYKYNEGEYIVMVLRTPVDIADFDTEILGIYTYNGEEIIPANNAVILKDGDNYLAIGTDFEIEVTNNVNAGTATVTYTGKGIYVGTNTAEFTIGKKEITVTPNAGTKVFGETDPDEFTYTVSGYIGATAPIFTGKLSRETGGSVGQYNILQGTLALADTETNYKVKFIDGVKFSITSKGIDLVVVTINDSSIVYDGTNKEPSITVKDEEKTLVEGTDYTVSYENNVNAGDSAEVVVTFKGDYTGTIRKTFTIEKADRTLTLGNSAVSLTYDNGAEVTVTYSGEAATVTAVSANTDVATATAIENGARVAVTSIGYGTTTVTVTVDESDNYNSKSETFEVSVEKAAGEISTSVNAITLIAQGSNGVVTYSYNGNGTVSATSNDASIAEVTVSGNEVTIEPLKAGETFITISSAETNQYSSATKRVDVTVNTSGLDVSFKNGTPDCTYDGSAKTPEVVVKANGLTLTNNLHYTLEYSNNVDAGTANIRVTGTGSYVGSTADISFIIKKANGIAQVTMDSWGYGETAKSPVVTSSTNGTRNVTVEYKIGDVYTFVKPSSVGSYEVRATFAETSNYNEVIATDTFEITGKDINNANVVLGTLLSYEYDGNAKEPNVTVSDGDLITTLDYEVSYSNNVNAGTATVTITGKGNYSGTKDITFEITKKEVTVTPISTDKIFGESDPDTFEYTISGYVNSVPTLVGKLSRESGNSVGEYNIIQDTLALNSSESNYTLKFIEEIKFIINPKVVGDLDLTIDDTPVIYDGTFIKPEVTVKDGDEVLVKDIDYKVTYSDNRNAGTAHVLVTGIGNYTGSNSELSFEIGKRTLNVTANNKEKAVGSENPPLTYSIDGQADDDIPMFSGSLATTATVLSGTGFYDITRGNLNMIDGGKFIANNYVMNFIKGVLTVRSAGEFEIRARDLIIKPTVGLNKTFTRPDPVLTFTYENVKEGEIPKFTGSLGRAAGEAAGLYAINLGSLAIVDNGEFLASNYNLVLSDEVVYFEIIVRSLEGAIVTLDETSFTYDGTEKRPGVTVVLSGVPLIENVDYEVSYVDNINAGEATVVITGIDKYITSGTEAKFTINKAIVNVPEGLRLEYNGSEQTGVAENSLYTVTGNKGTAANEYHAVVSLLDKDNYEWSTGSSSDQEVVWYIIPKPIDRITLSDIENEVYTGSEIKPTPSVKYGDTYLNAGIDFDYGYEDNIDASDRAIITITFKGNYSGAKSSYFVIQPKDVTVTWGEINLPYTGEEQAPTAIAESGIENEELVIEVNGKKKDLGTNYTATASIVRVIGGRANINNYVIINPTIKYNICSDNYKVGELYYHTLQEAFNAASDGGRIEVMNNVLNEKDAVLDNNKKVTLDLGEFAISMNDGKSISILEGSTLRIEGENRIIGNDSGNAAINVAGRLEVNSNVTIGNANDGYAIIASGNGKVILSNGNITAKIAASDNAEISIGGSTKVNVGDTDNVITLLGDSKLNMTNGSVIARRSSTAIRVSGNSSANISGGMISAEGSSACILVDSTNGLNVSGDVIIRDAETAIWAKGNVVISGGTIIGNNYGIVNENENVVIGKKDDGIISKESPIIRGQKVAYVSMGASAKLELYDGTLQSKANCVIYQTTGNIVDMNSNTPKIYIEDGTSAIVTPTGYHPYASTADVSGVTYNVVYLRAAQRPSVIGPNNVTVNVGEKGTFTLEVTGGIPNNYTYQWQVSTNGGLTWEDITGANNISYTTPEVDESMNGNLYRCVVSNVEYTVESRGAKLIVNIIVDNGKPIDMIPVGRFTFTNGKRIVDYNDKDAVQLEFVIKSSSEIKNLVFDGKVIGLAKDTETEIPGRAVVTATDHIIIRNSNGDVSEHEYKFEIYVFKNGNYVAEFEDEKHAGKATQTIDIFNDAELKVEATVQGATPNRDYAIVTFVANRTVKFISTDNSSLDVSKLFNAGYGSRFTLNVLIALDNVKFTFEDRAGYRASVNVTIAENDSRNQYLRFTSERGSIGKIALKDAFDKAQNIENEVEIKLNSTVQARYGVSAKQIDAFMSRPRDIGAADILANASTMKTYDPVLPNSIEGSGNAQNAVYGLVENENSSETYVSAYNTQESLLSKLERKYVDLLPTAMHLYKGLLDKDKIKTDDGDNTSFRATIIIK